MYIELVSLVMTILIVPLLLTIIKRILLPMQILMLWCREAWKILAIFASSMQHCKLCFHAHRLYSWCATSENAVFRGYFDLLIFIPKICVCIALANNVIVLTFVFSVNNQLMIWLCLKDEHPSLHAFASFISKFDIPHYQNNERREPFSASMFKGIIEKFIADLPPCPSDGRKTRVDAQEFLVFIMDRMHEDLLKLRGSSSVQDDWETIQRNNKYTEIWTKKFVASELSDMFWGQERIIINRNGMYVCYCSLQTFLMICCLL